MNREKIVVKVIAKPRMKSEIIHEKTDLSLFPGTHSFHSDVHSPEDLPSSKSEYEPIIGYNRDLEDKRSQPNF